MALITIEEARTNPQARELIRRMGQEAMGQTTSSGSKAPQTHNRRKPKPLRAVQN